MKFTKWTWLLTQLIILRKMEMDPWKSGGAGGAGGAGEGVGEGVGEGEEDVVSNAVTKEEIFGVGGGGRDVATQDLLT